MRYLIKGAKRDTGESISIAIDAPTATEAERQANDLGILVAEVAAEEPQQSATAPPTAQPAVLPKRKTNWAGLTGLILSIVGFATGGCVSPVALLLSCVGMARRPRGFAMWGLILSCVGCMWLASTFLGVFGPSIDPYERPVARAGDRRLGTPNAVLETPLEKAALVITQYSDAHGELPLTKWGQHLITEWEEIRDEWGNHLRYKRLDDVQFEIRSVGSDSSDPDDDLVIIRPKPSEIADADARRVAERRQAQLDDRARRQRQQQAEAARRQQEQEAEAERIARAPQTLEVQVLKWYMASQSHAALDIRFINTSNAYLGAWSISVELYDATGRYLGSNTVMTIELRPGKAKVEQCVFIDTNVGDIAKWTVTLDAVVGESGLRVDRQFELQVSAP